VAFRGERVLPLAKGREVGRRGLGCAFVFPRVCDLLASAGCAPHADAACPSVWVAISDAGPVRERAAVGRGDVADTLVDWGVRTVGPGGCSSECLVGLPLPGRTPGVRLVRPSRRVNALVHVQPRSIDLNRRPHR
jgi:hypothetical protein